MKIIKLISILVLLSIFLMACEKENGINDIVEVNQTIDNNIALSSLGATAEDNGSFKDYGKDQDAMHTIDNNADTYWAGLVASSPQQMWINFDQTYTIDKILIKENNDNSYINTGIIEYFDGMAWHNLISINKSESGFFKEFSSVDAKGIRITVNSLTAPSSWYNKVACLHAVEVYSK